MPPIAIHAARAFTPLEEISDAVVLVEDSHIVAVGQRAGLTLPKGATEVTAPGQTLVPGFVDVHIHGAGGHDVMEAAPAALQAITSTVARHGTTSVLATTVTASIDDTCRSLEGISSFIRQQRPAPAAEILGVHLEGPFLSHARRGVQPAEWLVPPSRDLLLRLISSAAGAARILTLAPELPGAMDLIQEAKRSGLVAAMGHTDATFEQTRTAIAAGARHAVHVFNAMRPFSHRETGVLGAILTSPEVSAELIADGVHVDPAAMRLLFASKGANRVLLVSDATAAAAMPDGVYRLGPLEVTVTQGVCRNADGRLAGSTLTLDRALRNVVALGVPLADALRMLTLNPAHLLKLETNKGRLAPDADADLVLLDEQLNVASVFCRGIRVV